MVVVSAVRIASGGPCGLASVDCVASCRGVASANIARSRCIIYRSWTLSMMHGAVPRRNYWPDGLDFDRADVAARAEGTAQAALIDGEVRAAQAEAAGRSAAFDGRAGEERQVRQREAAIDGERCEIGQVSGDVGGDQSGAAI